MVRSYFAWLPLVWGVGTGVLFYVPVLTVVQCPLIVCGLRMPGVDDPRGGRGGCAILGYNVSTEGGEVPLDGHSVVLS